MSVAGAPHLEDYADRIQPGAAARLLLWLIAGFFVVFVAWAALAKVDRTVHAAGRIVTGERLQVLSHLEGGTVAAILVAAGDPVRRGQELVRLAPMRSQAELGRNVSTIASLRLRIARLEGEVLGREPRFPTPADAEEGLLEIERALHRARIEELASRTQEARARAVAAQRAIGEAGSAYRSRLAARASIERQLAMIRPLVVQKIEPEITLVQLESQLAVATSDAEQAREGIARARATAAEAGAAVSGARQEWLAKSAAELAATQAEFLAASRTTPALADEVRRTTVVSPVDGRVNRVLVTTVGGSVAPNQPLVEVVAAKGALVIEALVLPKDIASVRVGQPARINVSAYESAIYGALDGEVVTISPDATLDERSGDSHFIVRVRVQGAGLRDRAGRALPIAPGMTADVNLLGDRRSILAYLLTPLTRLRENAFRE